jgi:hypothetical protein
MRDKQTFIAHLTEVSQSPSLREGIGVGSNLLLSSSIFSVSSPKGEARRGLQFPSLREGIGVGSSPSPKGEARRGLYITLISSTSKMSAEYGGIDAPAPDSP